MNRKLMNTAHVAGIASRGAAYALRMLAVAALLVAAGCVNLESVVTLNPDGTGIFEAQYTVQESSIVQIRAMMKLKEQLARVSGRTPTLEESDELAILFLDANETHIKRKLDSYARYGITTDRIRVNSRLGQRHVLIQLSVADLARASKADVFRDYGFSLQKTVQGTYQWSRTVRTPAEDMPNLKDPVTLERLNPLLKGLRVVIKLEAPGRPLRTNAPSHSDNATVWTFDFDKDPADFPRLFNHSLITEFDGSGLSLPEIRGGD